MPRLAQPHAAPQTPHREHRREREHAAHRRASRQLQDNITPSTPLVLSPAPAHVKGNRRAERGGSSRDVGSVQPLAPTSRRASQQQREALASAGLSPHPYAAAPSPMPYRSSSAIGGYGRQSPIAINALPNGHGMQLNSSDTYLFGQTTGKPGTNSRDTTTAGTAHKDVPGVRTMGVYDREQMQRVGEQDEDGGHGRGQGLWATLCCRA